MLKKVLYGCTVVTIAVGLSFAFTATGKADGEDKGPETIVLKTEKAKKPATLPHRAHQKGMDCKVCHESPNFKKGAWTQKDGHALCKDCHKNMTKDGKKSGPTKCKGCHIKK